MSFSIDNSEFLRGMKRMNERVEAAQEEGGAIAGMELLRDSVMTVRTVPIDEGTLRGAGGVIVQGKSTATSGALGYPVVIDKKGNGDPATIASEGLRPGVISVIVGFNTPYAARLHEHPEFNFKEPGSGGKYLEQPLFQNAGKYRDLWGKRIRKAMAAHG